MTLRCTLIALLLAGVAVAFVCTQFATQHAVDENAAASGISENGDTEDAAYWIEFMREGASEARKEGREALIALGAEAVPLLIETTEDPWYIMRWEAVNAVGIIAHDDSQSVLVAIPALVHVAFTDENPHPRWRSLWALSVFRAEAKAERILPALPAGLDASDDQHRWHAVVALAFFHLPEAAPYLNEGLDRDEFFDCWEAVFCLSFVHNERSAALLIDLIQDVEGRDVRLRREAARTLRVIGDRAAVPALLAALSDPDAGVRFRAASALANLAGPSVLPELEEALTREDDSLARETMERVIEELRADLP